MKSASSLEECAKSLAHVVVESLNSDSVTGLASNQIASIAEEHGWNKLPDEEKEHVILRFLEKFKDPLILLLLGSAVLSVIVGQYEDAFSIFAAVVIVGSVGFYQESASEESLAALHTLVPPTCHVIRDGGVQDILAEQLVLGDIVKLTAGDRVPADLRIVHCQTLSIDESSMTGESEPRMKTIDPLPDIHSSDLTQFANIAFMGTLVCSGNALGVVIQTGENSEFGKTFAEMKEIETKRTPLQVKMDELGKFLSIVSMCIIFVIGLLGMAQGKSFLSMFNIGVSLAVAAIPEGLPICVTVTLALGVLRMAKKKAIIKKMPAVEALGCADVICTDKTGTLTQNHMTVSSLYCPTMEDLVLVSSPDDAHRQLLYHGYSIDCGRFPCMLKLFEAMTLCNNASATGTTNAFVGQPTEVALMDLAVALNFVDLRKSRHRLRETPFSSEVKCMEVVYEDRISPSGSFSTPSSPTPTSSSSSHVNNKEVYYVKGALEVVLPQCVSMIGQEGDLILMNSQAVQRIERYANEMARDGLRVLALAQGVHQRQLTFCGIIGLMDPLRNDVKDCVHRILDSGARVMMITGDAQTTALSIGALAGLYDSDIHSSVSGEDIDNIVTRDGEDALASVLHHRQVTVCYRTSPRHKLLIVRALQAHGHVVVMTGDGVNDAAALKAADIGVAMGSGTDVAKEASSMVIVDDSFATIVSAIEEGKSIFYNIKNFITFQLSTSIAALSLVAINNVLGRPNPLNPMQILWINIIMDGPLAQSLGMEPVDTAVMKRAPRKRSEDIISRQLLWRVLSSGLLIMCGTLFVFWRELEDGEGGSKDVVSKRDLTMTFSTFVMFDLFNSITCRHNTRSVFRLEALSNPAFLGAVSFSLLGQFLVVYFPPLQSVFRTVPLSLSDVVFVMAVASSIIPLDYIRKRWFLSYFVEPVSEQSVTASSSSSSSSTNIASSAVSLSAGGLMAVADRKLGGSSDDLIPMQTLSSSTTMGISKPTRKSGAFMV